MFYLIFLLVISFIEINGKYICTLNHTITLKTDEVYFIESPDFPRPMIDGERIRCSFNFTTELLIDEEDKRYIFAITNTYGDSYSSDTANFTVYQYQPFYYFKFDKFSAFQGYAFYDDWRDDCYLESISRENPFYFTDETQIISLKYNKLEFQNKTHPCLWQFKAPIGYGFKIFIDKMKKDKISHFSISNNEYAFANEKDVKDNFPYYSYNNYLKIVLFEEDENLLTEFSAYISIFKLQYDMIDANCSNTVDETDIIKWTNIQNSTHGYLNNAKCSYKIVVKPNTEILVQIEKMNVEAFVDHVYFYFDGNENLPYDISGMLDYDSSSLYPHLNNNERTVQWEFISDGSVQSLGFSLTFQEISCSCGEPILIVPCEGKYFFKFMNRTDGYYCGNLNCSFEIILDPKCNQSQIIKMEIDVTPDGVIPKGKEDIFDVFRVIADNITVLEINHLNHYRHHTMFFYANSSNVFQAITASNFYTKNIFVELFVFGAPTDVSTIILTSDKPYYAYHISENIPPNLFNIKLSEELKLQNASIEMYSSLENIETVILFFNNESITHKINFENCFVDNIDKSSCKTFKTEFSVFHFGNNYDTYFPSYLLFQSSTHTNGCVFKNNVHNMHYEGVTIPVIVSAMSNKISSCRIFIFPYPMVEQISSIWTTPKINGSLKIYAGSEHKQLAVIDSHTTSSWHDILLNSHIYMIEIPINAAIAIYIGWPDYARISNFPYNSILTSPHFGEPKMKLHYSIEDPYMTYKIDNYDVEFTLIEYKPDSQIQFYFIVGENERINITSNFGKRIFSANVDIKIYYVCFSNTSCYGQDMLFQINAIEKVETTTSLFLTTSTDYGKITKSLNTTSFSSSIKIQLLLLLFIACF